MKLKFRAKLPPHIIGLPFVQRVRSFLIHLDTLYVVSFYTDTHRNRRVHMQPGSGRRAAGALEAVWGLGAAE